MLLGLQLDHANNSLIMRRIVRTAVMIKEASSSMWMFTPIFNIMAHILNSGTGV